VGVGGWVGTFLDGLGFGMVLQLSVGPVCLAVLQRALAGRRRHALAMVLGVAAADALYIALAVIGVSTLIASEVARLLLGLGGAVVLAYYGLRMLLRAAAGGGRATTSGAGALAAWRNGFVLTLTNPLTILFWGAVFAGLGSGSLRGEDGALVAFASGCIAATLLFLSSVVAFGGWLKSVLTNPAALLWLDRGVGLFLIGFAVKLATGAWPY
jgi:threonine/homoserine/homoserine lactone efflux protein